MRPTCLWWPAGVPFRAPRNRYAPAAARLAVLAVAACAAGHPRAGHPTIGVEKQCSTGCWDAKSLLAGPFPPEGAQQPPVALVAGWRERSGCVAPEGGKVPPVILPMLAESK